MSIRAIDRRFTQMIAYFLVMNSKRCIARSGFELIVCPQRFRKVPFSLIVSIGYVLTGPESENVVKLVAWLVYARTYCVPIATLNRNKRTRLLYFGDAQIISK